MNDDHAKYNITGAGSKAAIAYSKLGLRVFPCRRDTKAPLIQRNLENASSDPAIVAGWWRQYPSALIGTPTGAGAGFVVFDIDVKHPPVNGFETLVDLGLAALPRTPTVRTRSGGMHLHLKPPSDGLITSSAGLVGPGLDWRGEGGYVILPSPGSGYEWWGDTQLAPLAEIPAAIMPRPKVVPIIGPARTCDRLTEFGERKLFGAVENILAAPNGEQESTLTWEVRLIGRLVGSGVIPAEIALKYLLYEIVGPDGEPTPLKNYDPHRPWRRHQLKAKIEGTFARGVAAPFPEQVDWAEIERELDRANAYWINNDE